MNVLPKPTLRSKRKKSVLGFTLIELLTVMVVLSILAGIALPRLRGAIIKAEAAEALGNMNVVKVAVITYQSDYNSWPPEAGPGQTPAGLDEYLPVGFQFDQELYSMDYDNLSSEGAALFNVGVTLVADRPELGLAVIELVGTDIWTDSGSRFTWIID